MTEDHTDKVSALLERDEERRKRMDPHPDNGNGHAERADCEDAEDDIETLAQVISDLKTALEETGAERDKFKEWADREGTLREEVAARMVIYLERAEAAEARVRELNEAFESELITPLQTRYAQLQQDAITVLWLMHEAKARSRSAQSRVRELELKLGWFAGHDIDLEQASSAQATIASLREGLEAIERSENNPGALAYIFVAEDGHNSIAVVSAPEYARRILAENDR